MKKVLVIEDNLDNMLLCRRILENSGYEIIPATTAEEGIKAAEKENPDLILMDIQLPDMDGLEATKRIRESETDKKIPIIALTSYAMAGDREKAFSAGCTGYIEKPINPDTFISEIEKYL